jgi:hypothetical protein
LGTITSAAIHALGSEPIPKLVDARAAAGAGSAALADLLDGPCPIIDGGFEVAIRGRMTETDQHSPEIDNAFQTHFRQAPPASARSHVTIRNQY